jgi:hypothetical protein
VARRVLDRRPTLDLDQLGNVLFEGETMNRAWKLVLVSLALFSIAAISAPGAQASYRSESTSTEITGSSTSPWVFKSKFGTTECSTVTYSGAMAGTSSETLAVHPSFSGCKALGFNATVTPTGCDFQMAIIFSVPPLTELLAPFLVACAAANVLHVIAAGGLCSINFGAQEGAGNVALYNEGSGSTRTVRTESRVKELKYEGVGGFCSGAGTGGTISGETTFKGTSGETQVGIWVEE